MKQFNGGFMTPISLKRHSGDEQYPDSVSKNQKLVSPFEQLFNCDHIVQILEKSLKSEFYTILPTCSSYLDEVTKNKKVKWITTKSPSWFRSWYIDSFKLFINRVGPTITALNLGPFGNIGLFDFDLADILKDCSNPDFYSISICSGVITDRGVESTARKYPNLKSIDLRECNGLTDVSLSALGSFCKSLTAVYLYEGSEDNAKFTSVGLIALAQGIRALEDLSFATHESNYDSELNEYVTDTACLALSGQAESLKRLELSSCAQLSSLGYRAIGNLGNLEKLTLHDCSELKDEDLAVILPNLTKLTHLELHNPSELTIKCLKHIIKNLEKLEYLEITNYALYWRNYEESVHKALPNLKYCEIEFEEDGEF